MKTRYRGIVVALVAIAVIGLCLLFALRRSSRLFRVTILPSLGGDKMGAHALNDRGQVVGIAQAADGLYHLFLWDREQGMQDLGITGGGRCDINNMGQIAGSMVDPNGNEQAFLREPGASRRLLGTLGGKTSHVMAINSRGQIVGTSETSNGSRHAFLWDRTHGMRDLGTLGGTESQGRAINDAGAVFGLSHTPTLENQPFVWDANDGMVDIDPSLARTTCLNGINKGAWVVGKTIPPGQGPCMAIWRKGAGPKGLFPRPLERHTLGLALLNDANQIVFDEVDLRRSSWLPEKLFPPRPRRHHYLWDPNCGTIHLDPYVAHGSRKDFCPTDINNEGCIVGIVSSGPELSRSRAVLLEPIRRRQGK